MNTNDYPWIRVWGRYLGSSAYFIDAQVQQARTDSAPDTAIYKSKDGSGRWETIETITSPYTRIALGLPPLPDATTNEHQVDEHQVDEHQVDEHQVDEQVDELGQLRERITARVAGHDCTTRAAAGLVCDSILINKIRRYVGSDGWIDWPGLAGDLITGLPWSGGEQRLARLACSLSDQLVYLDDIAGSEITDSGIGVATLNAWSLAECLYGLDDTNRAAVVGAVHYAATGRPLRTSPGPVGGEFR